MTVGVKPTTSDDAVQVGVEAEVARPSVEDAGDAELSAESFGISAQLKQGLACCGGEQAEEELSVAQDDVVEKVVGDGKDDVEVVGRQEPPHTPLDPAVLPQALAGRTVSVAAGVVDHLRLAALLAHVDPPTQDRGPAGLDGAHHHALGRAQRMALAVGLTVSPEDGTDR